MIRVTRTPFDRLSTALKADLIARQSAVDTDQVSPDAAWKAFPKSERVALNDALENDFHRKCAYCEMGLDKFSADVEHFWPKSAHKKHNNDKGTPKSEPNSMDAVTRQNGGHGMFVWANLLWSCKTCNGFECKASHMKWNDAGQTQLLNPCRIEDDPLLYLNFCVDLTNNIEKGRVYPKPDLGEPDLERAKYTIHRLKLRERDLLVRDRAEQAERFLDLVGYLRQYGVNQLGPSSKTIGESLLQLLNAETKFLAPIRQLLFDPAYAAPGYDNLYAELKTHLPGLDDVLSNWNAFPPRPTS